MRNGTQNMRLIKDNETQEILDAIRQNGIEWADGSIAYEECVTGPGARFTDADYEDDDRHEAKCERIRDFVLSQL